MRMSDLLDVRVFYMHLILNNNKTSDVDDHFTVLCEQAYKYVKDHCVC